MNTIQNFNGRARDYTIGRPAYSSALIDYLYTDQKLSEQSVIADIGSGTGKFAKQLLLKGSSVFCVEPNDDMRNIATNELCTYKEYHAINGTANNTTLAHHSVDFITTAQAFHWFEVEAFSKECRRIIKPNGKVILVWNIRDITAKENQASQTIFAKFCPKFKGFSGGIQKDDERIKKFFQNEYEYVTFDNPLYYDKNKFIHRSLSSSYSLKEGDTNYPEYLNELAALFEKYSTNGILTVSNQTVAYIGTIG